MDILTPFCIKNPHIQRHIIYSDWLPNKKVIVKNLSPTPLVGAQTYQISVAQKGQLPSSPTAITPILPKFSSFLPANA